MTLGNKDCRESGFVQHRLYGYASEQVLAPPKLPFTSKAGHSTVSCPINIGINGFVSIGGGKTGTYAIDKTTCVQREYKCIFL